MHRTPAHPSENINFSDVARRVSEALGSPWAFGIACVSVLLWGIAGSFFSFSDAWQLVINTGTTVATFLMVFLLQNTQNRDARALQLKLDELIRGTRAARNRLIDLEDCTEDELNELQREFERMRQGGRAGSRPG